MDKPTLPSGPNNSRTSLQLSLCFAPRGFVHGIFQALELGSQKVGGERHPTTHVKKSEYLVHWSIYVYMFKYKFIWFNLFIIAHFLVHFHFCAQTLRLHHNSLQRYEYGSHKHLFYAPSCLSLAFSSGLEFVDVVQRDAGIELDRFRSMLLGEPRSLNGML